MECCRAPDTPIGATTTRQGAERDEHSDPRAVCTIGAKNAPGRVAARRDRDAFLGDHPSPLEARPAPLSGKANYRERVDPALGICPGNAAATSQTRACGQCVAITIDRFGMRTAWSQLQIKLYVLRGRCDASDRARGSGNTLCWPRRIVLLDPRVGMVRYRASHPDYAHSHNSFSRIEGVHVTATSRPSGDMKRLTV